MEPVTRAEGSQRSVVDKDDRVWSNRDLERVYNRNNTLTWRSVLNALRSIRTATELGKETDQL